MSHLRAWFWPVIGLVAVVLSARLLYHELATVQWSDVTNSFSAISTTNWLLAVASTFVAYGALAWYDRIAVLHLGRRISWPFLTLVSFTTYALSHNIGASVFSGAVVRYRAYSTKGLTGSEIGLLVAFCSFTFAFGIVILGGIVLFFEPEIVQRLPGMPQWFPTLAKGIGAAMLGAVCVYVIGSLLHFKPLVIRGFHLTYPRPAITGRQIVAAPLEIMGAAGIIYFALPEIGNPGYFIVLGVFLASFSAALLSNAPGGVGVLEFIFLAAMPDMPKADVLAALLVFRLLYLLIPLAFSLIVVFVFERGRLLEARRDR
jgi:glycosyltransferase 2 family protein